MTETSGSWEYSQFIIFKDTENLGHFSFWSLIKRHETTSDWKCHNDPIAVEDLSAAPSLAAGDMELAPLYVTHPVLGIIAKKVLE